MKSPGQHPNAEQLTSSGQAIEVAYRNHDGTNIIGSRLLGEARTGMESALSREFDTEVSVAGTTWVFTGPNYQEVAENAANQAHKVVERFPDELGGIGVIQLPGTRNGEDSITVVLASGSIHDPDQLDDDAVTISNRVSASYELRGIDIQLPYPPPEEM